MAEEIETFYDFAYDLNGFHFLPANIEFLIRILTSFAGENYTSMRLMVLLVTGTS